MLTSVPIGAHRYNCTRQRFASSVLVGSNFLRYYPGEFLKLLTEPKALIVGTSRAAITKELCAH